MLICTQSIYIEITKQNICFFPSTQDFIFCKNDDGEFGGLYRRATLTGLSRKADFFTFTSGMLKNLNVHREICYLNT